MFIIVGTACLPNLWKALFELEFSMLHYILMERGEILFALMGQLRQRDNLCTFPMLNKASSGTACVQPLQQAEAPENSAVSKLTTQTGACCLI